MRVIGGRTALLAVAVLLSAGVTPPCTCAEETTAPARPVALAIQPWRPLGVRADLEEWTGLDRVRAAAPAAPAGVDLDDVSWRSAFEAAPAAPHDPRTLWNWRGTASSRLWDGSWAGDLRVLAVEPSDPPGGGPEPRRSLRMGVSERWRPLAVGLRFESVSPGMEGLAGGGVEGETAEAWVEGREGAVRLRLSAGQIWDNVMDQPWKPRTTRTEGGPTVTVSLPLGASLSLAYREGVSEREPGPRPRIALAAEPRATRFRSVVSALSCGGPGWSATASSTYAPSADRRAPGRETVSLAHDASATVRLLPSLTITPALGLGEDTYEWSGIRSRTASLAVAMNWSTPVEGVDVTLSGSYARHWSSDDLYDATAINAAAGLVWRLPRAWLARSSLAFEVGSTHYRDAVTPSAGQEEVYGLLTLQVVSF